MARTLYKRSTLAQTVNLNESTGSENSSVSSFSLESLVNKNNHVRSRGCHSISSSSSCHQHSVQDHNMSTQYLSPGSNQSFSLNNTDQTSWLRKRGDSDEDDDETVVNDALSRMRSNTWSFFSWRKKFYFVLSKPTHFDVEFLARIANFGKWKTALLLLLLLLLLLFASTWNQKNTTDQVTYVPGSESRSCHFIKTWWPLKKMVWFFVPHDELHNQCGVSLKDSELDDSSQDSKDSRVKAFEFSRNVDQKDEKKHTVKEDVSQLTVEEDVSQLTVEEDVGQLTVKGVRRMSIEQDIKIKPEYPDTEQSQIEIKTGSEISVLNREEMTLLIQEVVKEEISQIFAQQAKMDKSKAFSKEEATSIIQQVVKKEISRIISEQANAEKTKEKEMQHIVSEMAGFNSKFSSLSGLLDSFKSEVNAHLEKSLLFEEVSSNQNKKLEEIKKQLKEVESLLSESSIAAKNCCLNETMLDQKIAAVLLNMLNESKDNQAFKLVRDWLLLKFATREQLQDELAALQLKMESQGASINVAAQALVAEKTEALKNEFMKDILTSSRSSNNIASSISHADVQKMIKEAISLYDADKIGEADYALESGGGAVVNTRCSEPYDEGRPSYTIFGYPLWNVKSSPRLAIQPTLHPGQCWAFKGSQGYLVIELSTTIRPTSFVIEHIPKSLSPTGSIDSAPKEFSVLGLLSEKDTKGTLLGEYVYDKDGDPLQQFPVQAIDVGYYPFVELEIHSNHGDLKYTCLYRFRVHGVRA